jgi:hypothetical protein
MRDGQLYVVGRLDDMISVNGHNVYAAEIESALALLGTIRRGCCTIVDVTQQGQTRLVALAKLSYDSTDLARLAVEMSNVASRTAGVRLDECRSWPGADSRRLCWARPNATERVPLATWSGGAQRHGNRVRGLTNA